MTSLPLVSIVTPTLNQGRFIEHTIRSIKNQTYTEVEHIVVDGGSTDETIGILRRHEGTYPMRWLSEPDRGMYDAVNKGMRLATGEILAYLNSDDLYFPWTLQAVVEYFERHPDTDFVFGDALNVDDETGGQLCYLHPPFNLDFVRRVGFLAQPTVFWRRRAAERVGAFDASLRFVGDCDYWMRAGASCSFGKVHEFLAVERNHRGTLRESNDSRLQSELDGVRARYVTTSGAGHRARALLGGIQLRVWYRAYWALLLIQSSLPARVRRGWWRRFLAADGTRIRPLRVLAMLAIPVAGRRFGAAMIQPSRSWLEPPA
jgi:glycosyltransferase involved in cell wall biosynthesis